MKKLITFLLLVCLLAGAGCSVTGGGTITETIVEAPHYRILQEGEKWYMELIDVKLPVPDGNCGLRTVELYYRSLAEMKEHIIGMKIPYSDLSHIKNAWRTDERGLYPLCHMENLYIPTLPGDRALGDVWLKNDRYSFEITKPDDWRHSCGSIRICTKDEYQAARSDPLANQLSATMEAEPTTTLTGVTTYYYKQYGNTYKGIRYTLYDWGRQLTIDEIYRIESDDASSVTSETVPYGVTICGKDNGTYFLAKIYDFTEKPTNDWIYSFSMKPYAD